MKKIRYKILPSLIIIDIIFTFLFVLFPVKNVQTESISNQKETYRLENNKTLEQYFSPKVDYMDSIGISFATYNTKNKHGKLAIELKEKDGYLISKKEIEVAKIPDNSDIILNFKKQKDSDKKIYILSIYYTEYYDDINLVVWAGEAVDNNYILTSDGTKSNLSAKCFIRGKYKTYNPIVCGVLMFGILLVLYGIEGDFNDEKHKK